MIGVHGATGGAFKLPASPAGRKDAGVAVTEHLVVNVREGGELVVYRFIDPHIGRVLIPSEIVGGRNRPFHIKRGFVVAARGRAVDISAIVMIGEIRVLVLKALYIGVGKVAGSSDPNRSDGRSHAAVAQRIAAMALVL